MHDVEVQWPREYGANEGTEFYLTVPEVAEHEEHLELPQCAIRGKVTGPDGKPVVGTSVEIARDDAVSMMTMFGDGKSAETDEAGRFVFEELQPGTYSIAAGGASGRFVFGSDDAPKHGRAVRGALKLAKDQVIDDADLVLSLPGLVEGVVRDAEGKPVAGATVFARNAEGQLVNRFGSVASRVIRVNPRNRPCSL